MLHHTLRVVGRSRELETSEQQLEQKRKLRPEPLHEKSQ